jgi:RNA polymerase sigma-70 factor (ECF subfamily)
VSKLLEKKNEVIRKIFYLFYEENLTINVIAQTLHLTESNVKNKLYRTLKELKEIMEGETYERTRSYSGNIQCEKAG